MTKDPFHYPRDELAKTFISLIGAGLSSSFTIFAPRRMGKTEFIISDLWPHAESDGYKVIYCNFWQNKDVPTLSLISAIEESNIPKTGVERLRKFGRRNIKSIELILQAGGVKAGVSADLTEFETSHKSLAVLSRHVENLVKRHTKIIFLLDEVQHLATDKKFSGLVSCVRTLFDTHSKVIKVVYTGSSREGLNRLFKDSKAPLFNSSSQQDLPMLEQDFIMFQLAAYKKATGRSFSQEEAWSLFTQMHRTPKDFRDFLTECSGGIVEEDEFLAFGEEFIHARPQDKNLDELFESLKAVDKILLRIISRGDSRALFSEETLNNIAVELGIDVVKKHTVQNAIARLRDQGVLVQLGRSDYEFEDAYLKSYVTNLVLDK